MPVEVHDPRQGWNAPGGIAILRVPLDPEREIFPAFGLGAQLYRVRNA